VAAVSAADRLEAARVAVRIVERFVLRELSEAEEDHEVRAARDLQRLTVGLRRKLDVYCPAIAPDTGY
jgi:hypothetical protein